MALTRRSPGSEARATSTTPIATAESTDRDPWCQQDQPSRSAIAVWLDLAVAPWHGHCSGCGHELGVPHPELAAAREGSWVCTRCLTELVRAAALAACQEVSSWAR